MKRTDHEQPGSLANKLLEILRLCPKMNSVRERIALLHLLAAEASRLMEAERASIFLLDRERNELWPTVALGSADILRFDARVGIAGAVVMSGQLINALDAQSDHVSIRAWTRIPATTHATCSRHRS